MKHGLLCLAMLLPVAGCAHPVQLVGYDRSDQILLELHKGIEEYHADEVVRQKAVRQQVAGAFVADVLGAQGDKARTTAATAQFLGLLDKMDANRQVEIERRQAMRNNINAAMGLNARQRALTEVRLGVGDDLSRHWSTLRDMALQKEGGK